LRKHSPCGSNSIENKIQGTGIGLLIVHSIMEKHNGRIDLTSELGKGSQFDVWLPSNPASPALLQ
jgi:signal transduction histidine kinase